MSAENVQLIRRLVEAFNDRDLDAMVEHMQPDAELHPLRAQLEGKAYRGHDGLREMLADFDQDWEYVQMDARGVHGTRTTRSSCWAASRARGRASGVELDVPMGFVWTLRDGKVVRAKSFSEQADALRAAGLE